MVLGTRRMTAVVATTVLTVGLVAAGTGPAGARSPRTVPVPTNVNISRAGGNQNESAIAIQRTNPLNITSTNNVETGAGLFHGWSTDGGATWQTNIIANGGPLGFACCDSQLAADEFGNIFLVYLADAVRVAISVDGGFN